VDENAQYRDAWADSKKIPLSQLLQNTAGVAQDIRHNAFLLDQLVREAGSSRSFRDFYAAVEKLSQVSRNIAYGTHNLKALCDFGIPPATLFTDHFINQFSNMSALKRTWWIEGPAFVGLAIRPGARILELGCGTGYYTEVFFSPFAADIVAIDIDRRAIETARRLHQAKNIRYEVMDFRKELPDGRFDLVVWSPTIVAYTPEDVHRLMGMLRDRMLEGALLCGWTAVEVDHGGPEILWHNMHSLAKRLNSHFKNVRAFERVHTTMQPPRHCLYFYASDGSLPFDAEWPQGTRLDT
jgi:SAM-dependent methyltransferase